MKTIKLLIIPAVLIVGCNSKKDRASFEDIAGTYVMEKTYEVRHEATGEPVGMATQRDTIIITKISDGYEVKNRKWKKNEFDQEGWVRLRHDAMPDYRAKFEKSTQILKSEPPGIFAFLKMQPSSKSLLKGDERTLYQKTK